MRLLAFRHGLSARLLAYGLCFAILAPAIGFAAFLQNELHTRELSHLHQFAQNRAALAAATFDDRMTALLQTLKGLAATPATATERIYDNVQSNLGKEGITLVTRGSNLDLLSRGSAADTAVASLDSPARTAAAAALATFAPQITTYGTGDKGGVNIWIASAAEGNDAVLLQAQIPSSYLSSAFKNFIADGPWSIAIVGSDGRIYAEANGKRSTHLVAATLGSPSLIDGVANIPVRLENRRWPASPAGGPACPTQLDDLCRDFLFACSRLLHRSDAADAKWYESREPE